MKAPIALLLSLCLLESSCEFLSGELPVRVQAPPMPSCLEAYAQEEGLELALIRSGGGEEVMRIPWGGEVLVFLPGRERTALLARPLALGTPGFFLPAGSLYPDSDRGGLVILDFKEGASALIAAGLLARGALPEAFCYRRLRDELAARAEDPWKLDLERLSRAIAQGRMSLLEIAPRPSRSIGLILPAGTWKDDDPLAPAFPGGLIEAAFPLGSSLLFDGKRFAALFVPSAGEAELALFGAEAGRGTSPCIMLLGGGRDSDGKEGEEVPDRPGDRLGGDPLP
jgi:hypothetical protein